LRRVSGAEKAVVTASLDWTTSLGSVSAPLECHPALEGGNYPTKNNPPYHISHCRGGGLTHRKSVLSNDDGPALPRLTPSPTLMDSTHTRKLSSHCEILCVRLGDMGPISLAFTQRQFLRGAGKSTGKLLFQSSFELHESRSDGHVEYSSGERESPDTL